MKWKRQFLFLLCITGMSGSALAQTSSAFSGWLAVFGTVNLNNKFSLHVETNLRSTNEWQQVQTFIFRTGLNYKITSHQTLTAGYAFVSNARIVNGVRGYAPEHRIWEQYSHVQNFNLSEHRVSLQNRFRLEQRFIGQSVVENNQLSTDGFSFAQRLRYFIRAILPLARTPEKVFRKGVFCSLQNEIFVNIQNAAGTNGKFFDQNRAYFSIGYRFSPKADLETGYMYQFVSGTGNAKTNNQILQLAAYIRL